MEWINEQYRVSTELKDFDMFFVTSALQGTWRRTASDQKIASAFANSLVFGLFDGEVQIGCVRAITDRRFVSWICDLFIAPVYRNKGLGRWLMECAVSHPDLAPTRLVFSATPEACGFYEHLGFTPMEHGYSMMPDNAD